MIAALEASLEIFARYTTYERKPPGAYPLREPEFYPQSEWLHSAKIIHPRYEPGWVEDPVNHLIMEKSVDCSDHAFQDMSR